MSNNNIKIQQNKIFTSEVNETRDGISIEFPTDIKNHLKLKSGDKKVHWVIVNGVVQVSGVEPVSMIPVLLPDEFQQSR
jgi:hypothetical protein